MSSKRPAPLLTLRDRRRFLAAVQYELFFTDLKLYDLDEFDLLQRLAETASPRTLKKALAELTVTETVSLIYYVFKHYREGSYVILATLEDLYSDDHPIHTLIHGFRSYYYDLEQELPFDLFKLIGYQEVFAHKRAEACFQLFSTLIPLIVESPIIIAQLTKGDMAAASQGKQQLAQYFSYRPSLKEFQDFARIFGLTNGIPFFWQGVRQPETSLQDKLQLLCSLFERPDALPDISPEEMMAFLSFTLNLQQQLEAIHYHPEIYQHGLQLLAFAMPTNKQLSQLPALPSLLRALQALSDLPERTPVFVFDQSSPKIFAGNQRYIASLSRKYGFPILHFSLGQILALGETLGVNEFLDTTKIGSLGFGGARNCVFLLTPVVKQLFLQGYKTVSAMLEVDASTLKSLLQTHVLGQTGDPGSSLFMIDDDVEIPPANLYCHAFFAYKATRNYTSSTGYAIGRATKFNIVFPSLERVLQNPKAIFSSTNWSTQICSAALSECVAKPKICLNLPFGSEEQHLRGLMEWNALLHPSLHLGGPRYPLSTVPTRPWCGLEDYLEWYLPYSIHVAMTLSLLDPANQQGRCVFPWNEPACYHKFSCLRDALGSIASDSQRDDMQARFWRNVRLFVQGCEMSLSDIIRNLTQMDVKATLQAYHCEHRLTTKEASSMRKIGKIYSFYQTDASILWSFSTLVSEGTSVDEAKRLMEKKYSIGFDQLPLTQGLYLLFRCVGLAEFNQMAKKLVS